MKALFLLAVFCHLAYFVAGHGRLINPASRNAMWRFGFENPPHYTDNELNCGGFATQWRKNNGKCGVCGDPWHVKSKKYEYPGKYCNGIIAKEYTQGDEIEVEVELTSNHQGWFEFRVGDIGKPPITQAKLKYLLHLVGGGTRFYLPRGSGNGKFKAMLKLPDELTCENCVFQWWYHCGNNWGCNKDGQCGAGKNPKQETFVNCADVRIVPRKRAL